ncbi:glycosyltransferase family 4 protein [Pseudomonas schmalbachii]|uniref:Glycosyltransferase family 4 protein n=1 Tax=Pseudomonas schmalbachii TaxID=2816993 RepID=A0ABS3TLN6_9PSED|nr:glycosyltransferase family 4 protein [Pseudomonas schmalbachii]MBO3274581.1 glycosyltransferase family 4 protein [Pseudomonas schmalbachii]
MRQHDTDLPEVVIVSGDGCTEETLEAIGSFLRGQTLAGWRWLIRSRNVPKGLLDDTRVCEFPGDDCDVLHWVTASGCIAWLHLDESPDGLSATALEQACWFFHSRPGAQFAGFCRVDNLSVRLVALRSPPQQGAYWRRGAGALVPAVRRHGCRDRRQLLMLVPWFETGGADRCNLDIAAVLSLQGWDVTFVATLEAGHRWISRFCELSSDLFVLPHFLAVNAVGEFMAELVERRDPDLVILSNCRVGYELLHVLQARRPQLPVVALNHMEEPWESGGYPGLAVHYDRLLTQHWVVSQHLQRWMQGRGIERSRVDVLHWFTDINYWKPDLAARHRLRERLGIAAETPVIAYAGRICRQKRPDLFVKCMRRLTERNQNFVALVMGDGELAVWLEKELYRQGLAGRVHLLGWVDDAGLREALQAADLFFLPSEAEGIALALYEAMATGLGIVAARVGGQMELVVQDCGHLIDPTSGDLVVAYSTALEHLIGDRDQLRRMGVLARKRIVQYFERENFEARLLLLVGQVLHGARPLVRPLYQGAGQHAEAHLKWQWVTWRLLSVLGRYGALRGGVTWRLVSASVKALFHIRIFGTARTWARLRRRGNGCE